jgi:hypothetical protein
MSLQEWREQISECRQRDEKTAAQRRTPEPHKELQTAYEDAWEEPDLCLDDDTELPATWRDWWIAALAMPKVAERRRAKAKALERIWNQRYTELNALDHLFIAA